MASKKKKKEVARMREITKHPTPQPKKVDIRRRVTSRATSADTQCTMKLRIYLSHNDEWFLHKNSCLDHCNHLPIAAEAMTKRANEMNSQDVSIVSNIIIIIVIIIYINAICTH